MTTESQAEARRPSVPAVLSAVYEASVHPELWPGALAALAGRLGAPGGFLQIGEGGAGSAVPAASFGLDVTSLLAYRASDPLREPLVPALCRLDAGVVCDGDGIDTAELAASELARLVMAPAGLTHVLGIGLACDEVFFAAIWFFRPAGAPFAAADVAVLRSLHSHLERAVAIHRRIAEAEQQAAASSEALDRVALGAIVTDIRGRPLLVNRLAERLLSQSCGLLRTPLGLTGETPAATAALLAAISDTITAAVETGRTTSIGVHLERRRKRRPLDVIVVSLRATQRGAGAGQSAIVFIADPERPHFTPERLLRDLYRLTGAEARLALTIAHGTSLTAAARQLDVSRNTVHGQLTNIFLKTGTTTQAELVRLINRGVGAIRPYEDSSEHRPVKV